MVHDVFISYSSNDKVVADAICSKLENDKIRCWIAPRNILPGATYGKAIIDGINGCKIVVIIFSSHSNSSGQVMNEIERAVSKSKIIIPVRIEDITPSGDMELFLARRHWLDAMTRPIETHIAALSDTIHRLLNMQQPGSISENTSKNTSPTTDRLSQKAGQTEELKNGPTTQSPPEKQNVSAERLTVAVYGTSAKKEDVPTSKTPQSIAGSQKASGTQPLNSSTNEEVETLNIPPDGLSPEPYAPFVGMLIKDSTGAETILSDYAEAEDLIIVRGSGSKGIRWNLIESVVMQSRDEATIALRDGKSLDHVKIGSRRVIGTDEEGFNYNFYYADLRSITLLRDTSVPEREAAIRDIPILAKRTGPNSPDTYTFRLEPDQEGILVTMDIFFEKQLATDGHQTFRLPGPHIFRASESQVSIIIKSIGLMTLNFSDYRTAHTLVHAFRRLNTLLSEEKTGKA